MYVQTRHAWYILKSPDIAYAATHAEFYRPHRTAQIVISTAMLGEITNYPEFEEQYVDAWDDLLGAHVQQEDLYEAVSVRTPCHKNPE